MQSARSEALRDSRNAYFEMAGADRKQVHEADRRGGCGVKVKAPARAGAFH